MITRCKILRDLTRDCDHTVTIGLSATDESRFRCNEKNYFFERFEATLGDSEQFSVDPSGIIAVGASGRERIASAAGMSSITADCAQSIEAASTGFCVARSANEPAVRTSNAMTPIDVEVP